MSFPLKYRALNCQSFEKGEFNIMPIRYQDRFDIMQWRNEQIYHLRQSEALTKESQTKYFDTIVAGLFEKEHPNQILFSYLKDGICLGYGGLVHINWLDKHAEISFVMKTELEQNEFDFHWKQFLPLLEELAFKELELHKLNTYAFDLRPHLYSVLEECGFQKEATLKEHCFFNGKYINVIIHSKYGH